MKHSLDSLQTCMADQHHQFTRCPADTLINGITAQEDQATIDPGGKGQHQRAAPTSQWQTML
jgi:hypothetical protein